jgi:hypothetical protein
MVSPITQTAASAASPVSNTANSQGNPGAAQTAAVSSAGAQVTDKAARKADGAFKEGEKSKVSSEPRAEQGFEKQAKDTSERGVSLDVVV